MKLNFNQAMAQSMSLLNQAHALLQDRWNANPADWEIAWKLAETLRQMGRLDQALRVYREVLRLNPHCREAETLVRILSGHSMMDADKLTAAPVPYVWLDHFLPQPAFDGLWDFILSNEGKFKPSEIRDGVDLDYRNSSVLDEPHLAEVKPRMLDAITEKLALGWERLGMESFDIKRSEMQMTSHSRGEFHHVHKDSGSGKPFETRMVTYVIYLFREPPRFGGGDLLLYDSASEDELFISKFTRIIPRNNSILFFPSKAWHQVTPVTGEDTPFGSGRFTINGWMHPEAPGLETDKAADPDSS